MKWNLISEKQPELGTDVLVCFEPGNPFAYDVCSLEDEGEGHYVWWRIEKSYPVDDTDYWAEIPMPQPRIPAYKEED